LSKKNLKIDVHVPLLIFHYDLNLELSTMLIF